MVAMIGLIAHMAGFDSAAMVGMCAICMVIAGVCCFCCAKGGCRACRCGKTFLRCIRYDSYPDSEVFIVVKQAHFTCVDEITTCIRITAGGQSVDTDGDAHGNFQQVLTLLVEQGTTEVEVSLLEHWCSKVLASLTLDVEKDIFGKLEKHDGPVDRTLFLKPVHANVLQPKVDISIQVDAGQDDDADGLHIDMEGMSAETQVLVKMQLNTPRKTKPTTEVEALSEAFAGPVEEVGAFGWNTKAYLGILGPPASKRHMLCTWDSKDHYKDRRTPAFEISLLRIVGVQPDPRGSKGFLVNIVKEDKSKERLQFEAVDRSRTVWVELLTLIIGRVRAERQSSRSGTPGADA